MKKINKINEKIKRRFLTNEIPHNQFEILRGSARRTDDFFSAFSVCSVSLGRTRHTAPFPDHFCLKPIYRYLVEILFHFSFFLFCYNPFVNSKHTLRIRFDLRNKKKKFFIDEKFNGNRIFVRSLWLIAHSGIPKSTHLPIALKLSDQYPPLPTLYLDFKTIQTVQ